MTLFEAREIFGYWRESPPVYLALKALFGGFAAKKPGRHEALGGPAALAPAPPPGWPANAEAARRLIMVPGIALAPRPRRAIPTMAEMEARERAAALRRQGRA